ncbi:MAG: hypothetical protein ABIA04_14355 [Pseudomonadota bacterium]
MPRSKLIIAITTFLILILSSLVYAASVTVETNSQGFFIFKASGLESNALYSFEVYSKSGGSYIYQSRKGRTQWDATADGKIGSFQIQKEVVKDARAIDLVIMDPYTGWEIDRYRKEFSQDVISVVWNDPVIMVIVTNAPKAQDEPVTPAPEPEPVKELRVEVWSKHSLTEDGRNTVIIGGTETSGYGLRYTVKERHGREVLCDENIARDGNFEPCYLDETYSFKTTSFEVNVYGQEVAPKTVIVESKKLPTCFEPPTLTVITGSKVAPYVETKGKGWPNWIEKTQPRTVETVSIQINAYDKDDTTEKITVQLLDVTNGERVITEKQVKGDYTFELVNDKARGRSEFYPGMVLAVRAMDLYRICKENVVSADTIEIE